MNTNLLSFENLIFRFGFGVGFSFEVGIGVGFEFEFGCTNGTTNGFKSNVGRNIFLSVELLLGLLAFVTLEMDSKGGSKSCSGSLISIFVVVGASIIVVVSMAAGVVVITAVVVVGKFINGVCVIAGSFVAVSWKTGMIGGKRSCTGLFALNSA